MSYAKENEADLGAFAKEYNQKKGRLDFIHEDLEVENKKMLEVFNGDAEKLKKWHAFKAQENETQRQVAASRQNEKGMYF